MADSDSLLGRTISHFQLLNQQGHFRQPDAKPGVAADSAELWAQIENLGVTALGRDVRC